MLDLESTRASFSYPDRLHPAVKRPLVEPEGWPDLAVLASCRRALGFGVGEMAAAMGGAELAFLYRAERGQVPRLTRAWLDRYARGLERLIEARNARQEALLDELAAAVQKTDPERTAAMLAGELPCPDLEYHPRSAA